MEILVDDLTAGYRHPCTVQDVQHVLTMVPESDIDGLVAIVLHQPTRKEEARSPRWGVYYNDGQYRDLKGPMIWLESVDANKPIRWKNSLTPENVKELNRLAIEGHKVTRNKREVVITSNLQSCRNTQLRTLLHEIGHHVDYASNPKNIKNKSTLSKEQFAYKYAENILKINSF
jgi:hypothetical protein